MVVRISGNLSFAHSSLLLQLCVHTTLFTSCVQLWSADCLEPHLTVCVCPQVADQSMKFRMNQLAPKHASLFLLNHFVPQTGSDDSFVHLSVHSPAA